MLLSLCHVLSLIPSLSDGRQDEAPCQTAQEAEASASAIPNTRSLHSHASSGLSESSDSLTDVSEYLVVVHAIFLMVGICCGVAILHVPSVY